MKSSLRKIFCLLLAFCMLLPCFAVIPFAEGAGVGQDTDSTEEEELVPQILYNRDYSDGWGVYNGVGDASQLQKGHNFYIDRELSSDFSYNYFARIEATNDSDGFLQLSFQEYGYPKENKIYIEFDIKADDYTNLPGILYFRAKGGSADGVVQRLLDIRDNALLPFGEGSFSPFPMNGEWVHTVIEFDYTNEELLAESKFNVTLTFTRSDDTKVHTKTVSAKTAGFVGLDFVRIGLADGGDSERIGMSYCIDNVRAYYNVTERLSEEDWIGVGYGSLVDENQLKTEVIEGEQSLSVLDYLKKALVMKNGVGYALLNDERVTISELEGEYIKIPGGEPVKDGDKVYVPLSIILQYIGYPCYRHVDEKSFDISTGVSATYITVGRDIATVDGETVYLSAAPTVKIDPDTGEAYPVICLDDVETLFPGFYVTYDDMGLIIVCRKDDVINRDTNLADMLNLMKRFVFDEVDAEQVYNDVAEKTSFEHPFLLADKTHFDRLISIYNGTDAKKYDVDLKGYIERQVKRGFDLYELFALPSDTVTEPVLDSETGEPVLDGETGEPLYAVTEIYDEYVGLNWEKSYTQGLRQPYTDMGGYDIGGRIGDGGTLMSYCYDMAFSYMITGDIKLAKLCYAMMSEVGEWDHWGPGHFLNVSETSIHYAVALDWIYNGIAEIETGDIDGDGSFDHEKGEYSIEYLQYLLYKNGVHMGYLASTGQPNPWPRPPRIGNDVYAYTTMENNWNSVCTGGMWMASLMLLENEQYRAEASELIAINIGTITQYGLDQYAPDGSYVESPGYWGYGTNYLLHGLMALWRSAGNDYGVLDCWGFDTTCYFACMAESSDYNMFNYNDGSEGQSVDSISFMFMAEAMNDPNLAQIRMVHINNGKGMGIRDFLFYPFDGLAESNEELPLDYYMEGIDAYTTRSSWNKGALYGGIIAGENNVSHGNVDSGAFIYHNDGVMWITDLGPDEYNVYQYFDSPTRYRYYRCNAEGNNTLALVTQEVDVPFGQKLSGSGHITKHGSNEYGSYAVIDNTGVYDGYAKSAYRGMLLTNNRSTFVIQDEVQIDGTNTFVWFAHFNDSLVDYEIAPDGRTMYLFTLDKEGRKEKELRISIVTGKESTVFQVTDCYTFRLTSPELGTVSPGFTLGNGGVKEKPRDAYKRISIDSSGISFDVAVVFEMMDLSEENGGRDKPVGYSFTRMNNWEPTDDLVQDDQTPDVQKRPAAQRGQFRSDVVAAEKYLENGTAYGENYTVYYGLLTNMYFVYSALEQQLQNGGFDEEIEKYEDMKDGFARFRSGVLANSAISTSVVRRMLGYSS